MGRYDRFHRFALGGLVGVLLMAFGAATSLSNQNVYTLPAAPTLPALYGSLTDPTFGTKIFLLSDQTDGFDTQVPYSYWPSMNSDQTRFHLFIDEASYGSGIFKLYGFNPATEIITKIEDLFTTITFSASMTQWSWTEPNVVYGVADSSAILRKMEITGVGSRTYTVLKDFTGAMAGLAQLWQMSVDGSNRYFCFNARNSSGVEIGVVVWDRTLDTFYTRDLTTIGTLNEARIDRSGAYVVITPEPPTVGYRWDFVAGSSVDAFPDHIAHHDVHTLKVFSNQGDTTKGPSTWDLTTLPLAPDNGFAGAWYSGIDKHSSWLTTSADYAYISTFKSTAWAKYQNEVMRVWTDNSAAWRRLCHHRSDMANTTNEYRSSPKGNISQNGRWFIFTTNWDNTRIGANSFHYGMMLKVPTEAEFTAGDYLDNAGVGKLHHPVEVWLVRIVTQIVGAIFG